MGAPWWSRLAEPFGRIPRSGSQPHTALDPGDTTVTNQKTLTLRGFWEYRAQENGGKKGQLHVGTSWSVRGKLTFELSTQEKVHQAEGTSSAKPPR